MAPSPRPNSPNQSKSIVLGYEQEPPAQAPWRCDLSIFVNGKKMKAKELVHLNPTTTLLSFLRANGLTGTKLGCAEGGCGACTAIISKWDGTKVRHKSVNACLFPAVSADGEKEMPDVSSLYVLRFPPPLPFCTGCNVVTVEGLGSTCGELHPVQERMTKSHGSQCGFCTPGIVAAMSAIFANNPEATVDEVEEHMDGNICRCTGYRPIWDTAKSLCSDAKKGPCGSSCNTCPSRDECEIEHIIPDPGCTPNNVKSPHNVDNNVCTSSHHKYASDPVFDKR